MSYTRGATYIWRDACQIHIWAEDGYDGWDEASWSEGRNHAVPVHGSHDGASGVSVRQEIADAYVMMRLAELVCEQRVGAVIESPVTQFGGNGGCLALEKLAPVLATQLEPIGLEPAADEVRKIWRA